MFEQAVIAHVGVAVTDLDDALAFYRDVLGGMPRPPLTADGATVVLLDLGTGQVELLHSADPTTPIGKFLAKRGPGLHHVCYKVPNLDAALDRCRAEGYRLLDEVPRIGAGGHRIAFVHPKATAGILIELTE